ncbi:MAG: flagellar protein FlgN [Thermoanaerobacteraceae bacterium]|nr:flagellar protein FlgN [Thermoanaerobacteraceae bacterium]
MTEALAEVLTRELELLLRLRDASLKEQEYLRQDHPEGIEEMVVVKEQLIKEITVLEGERQRLHHELAAAAGISPEAGLRELLEAGVGSREMAALGEKMRSVVAELREINETNSLLIGQSLAYARKMLGLLTPYLEQRPPVLDKSV